MVKRVRVRGTSKSKGILFLLTSKRYGKEGKKGMVKRVKRVRRDTLSYPNFLLVRRRSIPFLRVPLPYPFYSLYPIYHTLFTLFTISFSYG